MLKLTRVLSRIYDIFLIKISSRLIVDKYETSLTIWVVLTPLIEISSVSYDNWASSVI